MKKRIELTEIQRQYLYELVSIDKAVNGAVPIHDPEVPRDVDACDGMGNSFRSYLMASLDGDFTPQQHKKIVERYWTDGKIGKK